MFYASDQALISAAVPFLDAARAAGEAAIMVCTPQSDALLSEQLPDDVAVSRLRSADVYRRAPEAITAYRDLVEKRLAAGARGVRVLAEVEFGEAPADWVEWTRYEAVVNEALAGYPLWSMCLYDERRLPGEVLVAGQVTHPFVMHGAGRQANARYVDPRTFLQHSSAGRADPWEHEPPQVDLADVSNVAAVRHGLRRELQSSELTRDQQDDLILAVSEVVTNAILYGGHPIRFRMSSDGRSAVCTVSDHGHGVQDEIATYLGPDRDALLSGGRGLWLVRHLCDHVDLWPGTDGFTVRLSIGD